jgi:hypothetical protein
MAFLKNSCFVQDNEVTLGPCIVILARFLLLGIVVLLGIVMPYIY